MFSSDDTESVQCSDILIADEFCYFFCIELFSEKIQKAKNAFFGISGVMDTSTESLQEDALEGRKKKPLTIEENFLTISPKKWKYILHS